MTERVREILRWYGPDDPGTLTDLARLLGAGRRELPGACSMPMRCPLLPRT
jgi:hypothetical protein